MTKAKKRKKAVKARLEQQRRQTRGRSQQLGTSHMSGNDPLQALSGSYLEMLNEKNISHDNTVGILHFKNQEDKYKFMYALCDSDGNSDFFTTNITRTAQFPGIEGVLTAVSYKRDKVSDTIELYNQFYGSSETRVAAINQ